jgi:hypothetical protein
MIGVSARVVQHEILAGKARHKLPGFQWRT